MAAAPADPMADARKAVAAAADELQRRSASQSLDEKLGAKDWWRLRAELVAEVGALDAVAEAVEDLKEERGRRTR